MKLIKCLIQTMLISALAMGICWIIVFLAHFFLNIGGVYGCIFYLGCLIIFPFVYVGRS